MQFHNLSILFCALILTILKKKSIFENKLSIVKGYQVLLFLQRLLLWRQHKFGFPLRNSALNLFRIKDDRLIMLDS